MTKGVIFNEPYCSPATTEISGKEGTFKDPHQNRQKIGDGDSSDNRACQLVSLLASWGGLGTQLRREREEKIRPVFKVFERFQEFSMLAPSSGFAATTQLASGSQTHSS